MVLLSFDTEEFDVPREHGVDISLDESMAVSVKGTNRILDILKECGVRATFFCTVTFAEHAPQVMQRIMAEGHEVASHDLNHWKPQPGDAVRAKVALEQLCARPVLGYRQPRMQPVDTDELKNAGYRYNSSMHPTMIPGPPAPNMAALPGIPSLPLASLSSWITAILPPILYLAKLPITLALSAPICPI